METEEQTKKVFDIKDMTQLLEDKTTIGTSLDAPFDQFKSKRYNIVNPPSSSKRILNNCTVRYYCQIYFYNEKTNKFVISDKNYKNIIKDKISGMIEQRKYIRYCLLLMSEGEHSLFEIDKKDIDQKFYQDRVDAFFAAKKKEKEKELKEIEKEKIRQKIEKEKEEMKKKGEIKEGVIPSKEPPKMEPRPKQEIKIDMNIVNDVPNQYKLEDKIYYRIYVEDVYIDKPPFPNNAQNLLSYVNKFNDEIKRLLQKEEKKPQKRREYNTAESWCNEIIAKIINMGKGKIKEEYDSPKFKQTKKVIEEKMKKPILNLMYIYTQKLGNINNHEIIRQAINLVEKTYYVRYPGQFDESFMKITGRYINCLIKAKDFSKAKKVVGIMKEKCSNLKDSKNLISELEKSIEIEEGKKNSEDIKVSKAKIKAGRDESKPDYDWQQGQNEEELNEALKKDVEQVKNNMDLINSHQ